MFLPIRRKIKFIKIVKVLISVINLNENHYTIVMTITYLLYKIWSRFEKRVSTRSVSL